MTSLLALAADSKEEFLLLSLKSQIRGAIIAKVQEDAISWSEVARRVGTSQPRMSNFAQGQLSKFSIEMLLRIAFAVGLGVSSDRMDLMEVVLTVKKGNA